jgi:hypothetical protein
VSFVFSFAERALEAIILGSEHMRIDMLPRQGQFDRVPKAKSLVAERLIAHDEGRDLLFGQLDAHRLTFVSR